MIRIGTVELGRIPRLVAVLAGGPPDAGAGLADVVELRIDMLARHDEGSVAESCRAARSAGLPLIATIRSADEGGAARLDDERRGALFAAVLPHVDAVDVELHAVIRDRIVDLAHDAGKPAIVSFHDFERTPIDDDLVAILEAAKLRGADVVKIATQVGGAGDLDRLLALLLEHREKNIVVIGMGPHGAASRVFFPLFGSLLSYGFVGRASAPGQPALAELARELERYSPDFAAARRSRTS